MQWKSINGQTLNYLEQVIIIVMVAVRTFTKSIHWRYLTLIVANTKYAFQLSKSRSCEYWFKLIAVCREFSNFEPEKQGFAITLSPEGEAKDATVELNITEIAQKDVDRQNIRQT